MSTCPCGQPATPGRSNCSDCRNRDRRERYATDESFRTALINSSKASYDPENQKRLYHYHRRKAFELLGGYVCKSCGFDDPRALQIDHVDDTGYLRRKEGEVGQTLYRKVIKTNGAGFQVLCANCNWIKKSESEGRTLDYYFEEELSGFKPRAPNEQSKVDPEDTYKAFHTEESASSIAKRLHMSKSTLFKWWVIKFGPEKVRERSRVVQLKMVEGRHKSKGHGVAS